MSVHIFLCRAAPGTGQVNDCVPASASFQPRVCCAHDTVGQNIRFSIITVIYSHESKKDNIKAEKKKRKKKLPISLPPNGNHWHHSGMLPFMHFISLKLLHSLTNTPNRVQNNDTQLSCTNQLDLMPGSFMTHLLLSLFFRE